MLGLKIVILNLSAKIKSEDASRAKQIIKLFSRLPDMYCHKAKKKKKGELTQWLRPAKPGCSLKRHLINGDLKKPGPLPYTMGGSHHGVTLLPGHRQTVIRDLQLRRCDITRH